MSFQEHVTTKCFTSRHIHLIARSSETLTSNTLVQERCLHRRNCKRRRKRILISKFSEYVMQKNWKCFLKNSNKNTQHMHLTSLPCIMHNLVSTLFFFYKHGLFSAEPQRAYGKACFQPQTCLSACLFFLNKNREKTVQNDVYLYTFSINHHLIISHSSIWNNSQL